ncbi:hypothetical protein H696_00318 [Fonticula alba]|uniref:Ribosomal protein L19 n=1 Tax=Fonticula alba TaxID=691883 RepID=A0A058ZEE1_FONAL|nr:hypothetical protein H696_00318 [Fonticula alba]KCV72739.1 hypothetical protein H696_00318 [Fonticula alba]|eukprot:XP_009492440.1 hypothetical protein H696_00318 [Fonticula alba]
MFASVRQIARPALGLAALARAPAAAAVVATPLGGATATTIARGISFTRAKARRQDANQYARSRGFDLGSFNMLQFLNHEQMNSTPEMRRRTELLKDSNPKGLSAGAIVSVTYRISKKNDDQASFTTLLGTVLAVRRKQLGSNILMRVDMSDTSGSGDSEIIEVTVPVFSPLITKLEVMRPYRARRSKLYYLRDQDDERFPLDVVPVLRTYQERQAAIQRREQRLAQEREIAQAAELKRAAARQSQVTRVEETMSAEDAVAAPEQEDITDAGKK